MPERTNSAFEGKSPEATISSRIAFNLSLIVTLISGIQSKPHAYEIYSKKEWIYLCVFVNMRSAISQPFGKVSIL